MKKINLVYMAGAIDNVTDAEGWRTTLSRELEPLAVNTFNPVGAYNWVTGAQAGDKVMKVNACALKESDIMVLRLMNKEFTVGTFRELETAKLLSIPVILWTNIDTKKFIYLSDVDYTKDKLQGVIATIQLLNGGRAN